MACPATRHLCEIKEHRQELPYCGSKHPDGGFRCSRLLQPEDPSKPWHGGNPGEPDDPTAPHDGDHAGYGFSITELVTWPK
jgi:hypothetical protein